MLHYYGRVRWILFTLKTKPHVDDDVVIFPQLTQLKKNYVQVHKLRNQLGFGMR